MTETLPIDGRSLTLEQFLAVARAGCGVSLDPAARPTIEAARRAVDRAVRSGRAVYGVTTGFGALSTATVDPARAAELQRALVASHASGVGPPLPADVVRGMMLLRANSLARGHSGVRPELIDRLLALLNRGLVPWIPETGSVGASGDLAPLAHLAEAIVGDGAFVGPDGRRQPAADVLTAEDLPPLALVEKEGISLVNGTALMASYLALAVEDVRALLEAALFAAATSVDALEGTPESFDDRLGALRGSPEERAIAGRLRELLAESELARPKREWSGQDPYTLRCIPQVLAPVRHALRVAREIVTGELNAVTDNPLVFEGDEFVSGGNFHGESLAWALDSLASAVQILGAYSERRMFRLTHPALNRGLPAFLAPDPGVSSGFMIPQTVAAALVSENATLAAPATAYSLPTSADQEDFVSLGAWAGAKLRRMIDNARRIVAIEWLAAVQALEYRRPKHGGSGVERAARAVRARVGPWTRDHSPAGEIEALAEAIRTGELLAEAGGGQWGRADDPSPPTEAPKTG